ncbi:MAG: ribonuclease Z [Nanoarchaeota archaeon]|nr:ribonuclease Z [Nanoarchaeota archaeon]
MTIKITFLGTADQIPSAKRNHTAILLTRNEENILIDCGEGTQRQFRKANLNPCKLTRLLITHWHGDHILGIPGLLQTLASSGYNKTLFVYGPKGTKKFFAELLKVFGFKKEIKINVDEVSGKFFETKDFYLEAKSMSHGIPTNAYSFVKKGQIRIDKNKLKKTKLPFGPLLKNLKEGKDVKHDGKKFKWRDLTYREGDKKISIVLDTLNNKNILSFVKNSDLLICESSFGEELKEKAKEHLHLTSRQAGEIAKRSNSRKLILTHISQRYEKNPEKILNEAKKVFRDSHLAKDLDVVEVK